MDDLSLVSSLRVPCGKYDTWNTPGEGYIDYRTLAVYFRLPLLVSTLGTVCALPSYITSNRMCKRVDKMRI